MTIKEFIQELRAKRWNYKKIASRVNHKYGTYLTDDIVRRYANGESVILCKEDGGMYVFYDEADYCVENKTIVWACDNQATLVLSDTHIGKLTKSYNTQRAIDTICWIIGNALAEVKHRYPDIKVFNIAMVGDIVDGMGIYPKQSHYLDKTLLNQIYDGIKPISESIDLAASYFTEVNIYCTHGNHGRASLEADELSNYDLMFYKALQLGCANINNVEFTIQGDSELIFDIGKYKALISHGSNMKSGAIKSVENTTTLWLASRTYKDVDVFIYGHYHYCADFPCQRGYVIMNGTTITDDPYGLEKCHKEVKPCQTLFITNNKEPVSSVIYLYPEVK